MGSQVYDLYDISDTKEKEVKSKEIYTGDLLLYVCKTEELPSSLKHKTSLKKMGLKPKGQPTAKHQISPYSKLYDLYDVNDVNKILNKASKKETYKVQYFIIL